MWLALALLAVGGVGVYLDRDRDANLAYRANEVGHVLITDSRSMPGAEAGTRYEVVYGEVVMSANRLVTLFARIKQIFGGEVRSYHALLTRCRREAVVRLTERAAELGYDAVCNLRIESVDLAGVTTKPGRQQTGVYVGMIAYGTAYRRVEGVYPPPAPPTLEVRPG